MNDATFHLRRGRAKELLARRPQQDFCGVVAIDDDAASVAEDHPGTDVVEKISSNGEFLCSVQTDDVNKKFRHGIAPIALRDTLFSVCFSNSSSDDKC